MVFLLRPVLDHYGVTYQDHDNWQRISCPAHDESRPSCSLNLETNYLDCHACGFKGHTLDLIAHREGIAREAAVAVAEGIAGARGDDIPERAGWRSGGRVSANGAGYRPRVSRGGALQARVRSG